MEGEEGGEGDEEEWLRRISSTVRWWRSGSSSESNSRRSETVSTADDCAMS